MKKSSIPIILILAYWHLLFALSALSLVAGFITQNRHNMLYFGIWVLLTGLACIILWIEVYYFQYKHQRKSIYDTRNI